jgi:hypothetical protein
VAHNAVLTRTFALLARPLSFEQPAACAPGGGASPAFRATSEELPRPRNPCSRGQRRSRSTHKSSGDPVFLSVRADGPKEGVLVAWGFTEEGERVLLSVMLGMRESREDWLALGRDLIARGLGAPLLIVADGAPGLIKAVEHELGGAR